MPGILAQFFFAKKKKTGKMSQCAWNVRTCSKSKLILKNITIHLGRPKQVPPNMFRALSPSTRAHSQVSTCANFYSTLPIFKRIQAEAGVIRWKCSWIEFVPANKLQEFSPELDFSPAVYLSARLWKSLLPLFSPKYQPEWWSRYTWYTCHIMSL